MLVYYSDFFSKETAHFLKKQTTFSESWTGPFSKNYSYTPMEETIPDHLNVKIWQGDWGLPSVDPKCLSVMVCCITFLARRGGGDCSVPFWNTEYRIYSQFSTHFVGKYNLVNKASIQKINDEYNNYTVIYHMQSYDKSVELTSVEYVMVSLLWTTPSVLICESIRVLT